MLTNVISKLFECLCTLWKDENWLQKNNAGGNDVCFILTALDPCGELAIVMVVDASGSINQDEFDEQKLFIKEFFSDFDIGQNKTQVGIIVFSDGIEHVLNFASVQSLEDINEFVNETMTKCPHVFCKTNTPAGIDEMTAMFNSIG